jgi:signal transduction histidine kinase
LAQLRHSTEQLEGTRAELQLLLREMVDAEERQRASLAGDIHDAVLQNLMYVSRSSTYCVHLLGSLVRRAAEPSPDSLRLVEELTELSQVAASAESELRSVITGIYPAMIESLGLPGALETLAEEFGPSQLLSVTVEYDAQAEQRAADLDKAASLHLYRIAQEAVRNASKHSGAQQVTLRVQVLPEPRRGHNESESPSLRLVMSIEDNGRGIPLPIDYAGLLRDRHLGLASMRDRAERVGGQFVIGHGATGGTRIKVSIPLPVGMEAVEPAYSVVDPQAPHTLSQAAQARSDSTMPAAISSAATHPEG